MMKTGIDTTAACWKIANFLKISPKTICIYRFFKLKIILKKQEPKQISQDLLKSNLPFNFIKKIYLFKKIKLFQKKIDNQIHKLFIKQRKYFYIIN